MRHFIYAFILTVSCGLPAYSQSMWKYFSRPDYSLYYGQYMLRDDFSNSADVGVVGFQVGWNLPFVALAENLSAGLSPNLGIATNSLGFDSYSGRNLGPSQNPVLALELPVFATLKYRNDATWAGQNGLSVGLSAGIGYQYSVFIPITSGLGAVPYGLPAWMAEINLGKHHSFFHLVKLRFTSNIGRYTKSFSDYPEDQVHFSQHAFHLVFTPGY